MNKRKTLLLCLVTFATFLHGCNKAPEKSENTSQKKKTLEIEEEIDTMMEKIKEMTIEEKIGQLIIVGVEGEKINEKAIDMIEKYHIGGFILFKENIGNSDQTLELINSLKEINSSSGIPLFMGLDEEGGRVSRLSGEFLNIPRAREIGKVDDEKFSYEIGSLLGEKVKSLGFNLDFAPVLDIDSNPKNPVIGDRSFGSNEEVVSKHGIAVMKGIRSQNVIPVIKHFPGHGDTSVDSHIDLPIVNKGIEELHDFELIPFKKGIREGADMVMIGHIFLPNIDDENPACLSSRIITELLRNDLKYNGVVITDDMNMGAIEKNYDIGEACLKSLKAGSDIVLVCHGHESQIKVINTILDANSKGDLTEKEIDEKVYRILKLKEKYKLSDEGIKYVDVEEINNKTNDIVSKYLK